MKVLIFFIIVIFLKPLIASSCSCVPQNDIGKSINFADAIFKGNVIKIDSLVTVDSAMSYKKNGLQQIDYRQKKMIKVLLEASEIIKGDTTLKYISVFTTYECCTCGFPFKVNGQYIVYGYYETLALSNENRIAANEQELKHMVTTKDVVLSTSTCSRTTDSCDSELKAIKLFLSSQKKNR